LIKAQELHITQLMSSIPQKIDSIVIEDNLGCSREELSKRAHFIVANMDFGKEWSVTEVVCLGNPVEKADGYLRYEFGVFGIKPLGQEKPLNYSPSEISDNKDANL